MAPAGRCSRRLRCCSYSLMRGAVCGGGWDLGSSDAARLRLAALGRGGGGAPAIRPLGWPGRWLGAVPPLALPPSGSRALSGELKLQVKGFAWGCWSRRRWRLFRHAERITQRLRDLEHGLAWRENGRVWVILGV